MFLCHVVVQSCPTFLLHRKVRDQHNWTDESLWWHGKAHSGRTKPCWVYSNTLIRHEWSLVFILNQDRVSWMCSQCRCLVLTCRSTRVSQSYKASELQISRLWLRCKSLPILQPAGVYSRTPKRFSDGSSYNDCECIWGEGSHHWQDFVRRLRKVSICANRPYVLWAGAFVSNVDLDEEGGCGEYAIENQGLLLGIF